MDHIQEAMASRTLCALDAEPNANPVGIEVISQSSWVVKKSRYSYWSSARGSNLKFVVMISLGGRVPMGRSSDMGFAFLP